MAGRADEVCWVWCMPTDAAAAFKRQSAVDVNMFVYGPGRSHHVGLEVRSLGL